LAHNAPISARRRTDKKYLSVHRGSHAPIPFAELDGYISGGDMKTKSPTCSHCGYEFDDEETWHGEYTVGKVNTDDGDYSVLKCPNCDCGETFFVQCLHRIEFAQIDADGEEI
jgi:hypothetical protein